MTRRQESVDETVEVTARPHDGTRLLQWSLRTVGCLDLIALIAVLMPDTWLEYGHRTAGLGTFPEATIAGYLARSASAMYVLHGLVLLFVSTDVVRYGPLIRFLAAAAIVHGAVTVGIDLRERMPLWWTLIEGPSFSATGLILLVAQSRIRPASCTREDVGI